MLVMMNSDDSAQQKTRKGCTAGGGEGGAGEGGVAGLEEEASKGKM